MSNSFTLSFLDAFGNPNLLNDTIQQLPAILGITWLKNGVFTLQVKDVQGTIVNEFTEQAEKDNTYYWDLKMTVESSIWHVSIDFNATTDENKTIKEHVVKILKVDPKAGETSKEEEYPVPPIDDIKDVDQQQRFKELDAHWLKVDPEKNLYRFVYNDFDKSISDPALEWFSPILLIHGYKSNHLTWNSLTRFIWLDGFRNIFATEILDPYSGIETNSLYLESITDLIFELTGSRKLIVIAHSLGGWIARYFVKQPKFKENILLFVSIASPQYGLFRGIMTFIYLFVGKTAHKLYKETSTDETGLFFQMNKSYAIEELYLQTSININGSVKTLGGSDGIFKPQIVPEMINFIFSKNHLALNKCDETITVVRDMLLRKAMIFKLRLLYIKPSEKAKKKSFNFTIKRKGTFDQVYPRQGYIELEEKQTFMPEEPLVLYMNYAVDKEEEIITLEIYTKIHTLDKKEILHIPLAINERKITYFTITTKSDYTIQLGSFSYKLDYQSN